MTRGPGLTRAVLMGMIFAGSATVAPAQTPADDVKTVVRGNNEFALDLYAKLRADDGNLFISPYSVSTALAMTWAGARGETARQMSEVLHFSLEQERLHPAFAALLAADEAKPEQSGYELHLANALWGQTGYDFLPEYLELTKRHYGAGLREVDFAKAAEQARQTINAWAEGETRQKIKNLLTPANMTPPPTLVLTNAIYFKGDWASRFDPDHTSTGDFHLNQRDKVRVPLMHHSGEFAYAATENVEILELPYEGDRLSMVVLLPTKADGLASLEKSLDRKTLERWLEKLERKTVRVTLPRFKLESRCDLATTLKAMGMTDAFGGAADFSGMTGRRELFISQVIHQTCVEVNEEGTEAAAATAVTMKRTSRHASFAADHPFLFLIRDTNAGGLYFIGRVANPAQ